MVGATAVAYKKHLSSQLGRGIAKLIFLEIQKRSQQNWGRKGEEGIMCVGRSFLGEEGRRRKKRRGRDRFAIEERKNERKSSSALTHSRGETKGRKKECGNPKGASLDSFRLDWVGCLLCSY